MLSVMAAASKPSDERERLSALRDCRVLDTPREDAFDDLAAIAAQICNAPVALVSFVDGDRQWFKARVNVEPAETPRAVSFCGHAILEQEPMLVPDTLADPRFADNPSVVSAPHFRFYAGVPLRVSSGSAVGTLCVLDYEPRSLSDSQLAALQSLGRHIERELKLRRALGGARSTMPPGAPFLLQPGEVVGRWTLVRPLGEGGAGVVFEARGDRGERAAIKFLRPEVAAHATVVERFVREARILARLESPHVARMLDAGNLGEEYLGLPYLVLEYLEGRDLEHVVHERQRVGWRQAVAWIREACLGVAAAHALGVIHRDLKPSNVFLAWTRTHDEVVKVLDFGIAKLPPDANAEPPTAVTSMGAVVGTTQYMSPEQMVSPREVDRAADVWALGAILYYLLSGQPPFTGRTEMEICGAVLSREPPPVAGRAPDVPAEVASIVERCLQKVPEARFESVDALAAALSVSEDLPDP
jgi:serine/threonine-protein kinase